MVILKIEIGQKTLTLYQWHFSVKHKTTKLNRSKTKQNLSSMISIWKREGCTQKYSETKSREKNRVGHGGLVRVRLLSAHLVTRRVRTKGS